METMVNLETVKQLIETEGPINTFLAIMSPDEMPKSELRDAAEKFYWAALKLEEISGVNLLEAENKR
jgi:hypothetical protein